MKQPIKVAITGAAGQIGYSLLFRIASGEVFGADQPVILHLVELPMAVKGAEGTAMELIDCSFDTLQNVEIFDSPDSGFDGVNWACLVGSKPRAKGMERKDLIRENGPIFVSQGKALYRAAADVRIVVVGNPCNTNCLIAQHNCRDIPPTRFSAMTMLDQNRAQGQLALKAHTFANKVKNMVIWGNHSSTMYPDFENAMIDGKPVGQVIGDTNWLQGAFIETVQKRGAAIIEARGKSSAASAASACIDHMKAFLSKTPDGGSFSAAVASDGSLYDIPPGLIFSFPLRSHGNDQYEIVKEISLTDFAKRKISQSVEELMGEREVVKDLLTK